MTDSRTRLASLAFGGLALGTGMGVALQLVLALDPLAGGCSPAHAVPTDALAGLTLAALAVWLTGALE
jgi:hypothetical protein